MQVYLGLDLGGSGAKALAFSATGDCTGPGEGPLRTE